MSRTHLLALDQGTTSSRALVLDGRLNAVASDRQPLPASYPADGWVEQSPAELFRTTLEAARNALKAAGVKASELAGAGIANQRETTVVWDRATGEPVHPAIVWQDRRTDAFCRRLAEGGHAERLRRLTGLLPDPYFSASKLAWILDEVPGVRERAERGELAFGTVDCWLIWCLTEGRVHATDATNASRTLLFDIHRQRWDEGLLELFGIPPSLLPEVRDCVDDFGRVAASHLGGEVPIVGVAGDQQAALIGQACFEPGMTKATYGTGAFLVTHTGDTVVDSQHRLLSTVAYRLDGRSAYALEGSLFIAGAIVQWLRDALGVIDEAAETAALAAAARPDHRVYVVPALTGLGAPHWDAAARGAVFGLTRDTGREELVAAALAGVSYQTRDLLEAARADGRAPTAVRVDGGMAANDWFCQHLADTLDLPIERSRVLEATAQGAAVLAALGAGRLESLQAVSGAWACERRFRPAIDAGERERRYRGWQQAVRRVRDSGD